MPTELRTSLILLWYLLAKFKIVVMLNLSLERFARFFKFLAKRQRMLDETVDLLCPAEKSKKLKDACRTCWIQRIDSLTHMQSSWSCFLLLTWPYKPWSSQANLRISTVTGIIGDTSQKPMVFYMISSQLPF